jgi:hypothetical protein
MLFADIPYQKPNITQVAIQREYVEKPLTAPISRAAFWRRLDGFDMGP